MVTITYSNGELTGFRYDVFNRRIKKTVAGAAGPGGETTTYFLYNAQGLIAEYNESGQEIRAYGWRPNSTWGTDPVFLRTSITQSPNSLITSVSYYINDHLGTPQRLINSAGDIVWSASYNTFGQASVSSESSVVNHLRFPGQVLDEETGWHYNFHRYYIPELGRYNRLDPLFQGNPNWLSRDPIGELGPDGVNLYGYVRNQPTIRIDPDGKSSIIIGGTVLMISAIGVIVAIDYFNDAFHEGKKSADKMQELYDNIDRSSSEDLKKRKDEADESRNKCLNSATQGALAVPGTTYSGDVPTAQDAPTALATAWSYVASQVINFFSN